MTKELFMARVNRAMGHSPSPWIREAPRAGPGGERGVYRCLCSYSHGLGIPARVGYLNGAVN